MPSGSPDRMLRRRKFIRLFSGTVAGGRLRRARSIRLANAALEC